MGKIQSFEDLEIWKMGIDLSVGIYKATNLFPKSEVFGLASQLNRSAVSVPSNIAEGFGRFSRIEFKRFLKISLGSLYELRTQLKICHEIGFIPFSEFEAMDTAAIRISKMILAILKS